MFSDIREKTKYERRADFKRAMPLIKHKLQEFAHSEYKITKKNKIKGYVYAVLLNIKLIRAKDELTEIVNNESLKFFSSNYENIQTTLKKFVINTTKIPYLSILNFDELKIDVLGNMSNKIPQDVQDKFMKLEIRLKGFFDTLSEAIGKLEQNTISFLKIITTDGCLIPSNFFTLFEINRIEIKQGRLIKLSKNQKMMILSFYILIKILLKNYLIEQMNSAKNPSIKKNFKMICSVIYYKLIEYYKSKCPFVNQISDKGELDKNIGSKQGLDMVYFKKVGANSNNKFFQSAVKKYYSNKSKSEENKVKNQLSMYHEINSKIEIINPDTDNNEVSPLFVQLYQYSDLGMYLSLEKQNKFDLTHNISQLSEKLYNIVWG
jgi:hypothetical protein